MIIQLGSYETTSFSFLFLLKYTSCRRTPATKEKYAHIAVVSAKEAHPAAKKTAAANKSTMNPAMNGKLQLNLTYFFMLP